MNGASILEIFDKITGVLGLIKQGKKEKDEKIDQAIFALYTALNETIKYNNKLKKKHLRNKEIEHKLADLWHRASVPLRYIDKDFSRICFYKGSYWLEPDLWSESKVKKNGIALNRVKKMTETLLLK